jgi:hypothetical protein
MTIIFKDDTGEGGDTIVKHLDLNELEDDIDSAVNDETGQTQMQEMRQAIGATAIEVWELWVKL